MILLPLKLMQIKSHWNGKEINLTSENTTIKSTNFNVDKNGNITATGGKIGGWNIATNELNNGKVFMRDDGSSTIYTVADLIIIRGYIMGIEGFELSSDMIKHYDFNGDGKVTSTDYVLLQNAIGISMK